MKQSISWFLSIALLALLNGPVTANDCGEKSDPCGKRTEWNEYESVRLRMKRERMQLPANWYLQSSRKNGDLRVDIDFPDAESPQHGTIMMVEGRVFGSKGI